MLLSSSISANNWATTSLKRVLIVLMLLSFTSFTALADNNDATTSQVPAIWVTTIVAKAADWMISIPAQGEILPWEVAILSTKTSGIGATEVSVVEGDNVTKGQVLARFDDRLLRAELAQAKANLALATASYKLAVANLQRSEHLKTKQLVSEQDLQIVSTQVDTAAATRDQAAAALVVAQIKLTDSIVTAPDIGKILQRDIELGQMPATGEVLFRMQRQGKLEWIAQFDASNLTQVKPNMQVQIDVVDQAPLFGKIRSVSPQLISNSKLAAVRVLIDGTPDLAVNSYVQGNILLGHATAIIVPASCLVIKDGKTWLFRVKNNTAEQALVSLGRRQQDQIEILSGIAVGDTLVQEGAGFLNNGDKLSIKSSDPVQSLSSAGGL